jgi:hypothetical protein
MGSAVSVSDFGFVILDFGFWLRVFGRRFRIQNLGVIIWGLGFMV